MEKMKENNINYFVNNLDEKIGSYELIIKILEKNNLIEMNPKIFFKK